MMLLPRKICATLLSALILAPAAIAPSARADQAADPSQSTTGGTGPIADELTPDLRAAA